MNKKKNNKFLILSSILVAVIVLAVAMIIFLLTNTVREEIKTDSSYSDPSSLRCVSKKNLEGYFFYVENPNNTEHQLKLMFNKDGILSIFYSYLGSYTTNSIAKDAEAVLHSKYNHYIADNNIDPKSISSNFSTAGLKVSITLFAEMKNMKSDAMKLFSINDFSAEAMDADWLAKYYSGLGFSCKK